MFTILTYFYPTSPYHDEKMRHCCRSVCRSRWMQHGDFDARTRSTTASVTGGVRRDDRARGFRGERCDATAVFFLSRRSSTLRSYAISLQFGCGIGGGKANDKDCTVTGRLFLLFQSLLATLETNKLSVKQVGFEMFSV